MTQHRPVGRRRIEQHFVAERHESVNVARNDDAGRVVLLLPSRAACEQCAETQVGGRRKRLAVRLDSVDFEQIRADLDIRVSGQTTGTFGWHRRSKLPDQFVGAPRSKAAGEVGTDEPCRRQQHPIGAVAHGAACLESSAPGRSLLGRERKCRCRMEGNDARYYERRDWVVTDHCCFGSPSDVRLSLELVDFARKPGKMRQLWSNLSAAWIAFQRSQSYWSRPRFRWHIIQRPNTTTTSSLKPKEPSSMCYGAILMFV